MNPNTKYKIMHDYVMLFPTAKPKTTAAGIILKEQIDATAPIEGFVVGVGPGRPDKKGEIQPMPVKAGDKVIFIGNSGKVVKHDGDVFIVVPVSEILCTINTPA